MKHGYKIVQLDGRPGSKITHSVGAMIPWQCGSGRHALSCLMLVSTSRMWAGSVLFWALRMAAEHRFRAARKMELGHIKTKYKITNIFFCTSRDGIFEMFRFK